MRYTIQKSDSPGKWVCTDTENLIVCVFADHDFNESQKMTMLEDFNPDNYKLLARLMSEMGDWLNKNHSDKIF